MLSAAFLCSKLTSELHFSSSHIGFLPKYIKHLKDLNFLKEDLLVGIHSEEVSFCSGHAFLLELLGYNANNFAVEELCR